MKAFLQPDQILDAVSTQKIKITMKTKWVKTGPLKGDGLRYRKNPKIVRSVLVGGKKVPAYFVRREVILDFRKMQCPTTLELGAILNDALQSGNKTLTAWTCWTALNFVHKGKVPKNWIGEWNKQPATTVAV